MIKTVLNRDWILGAWPVQLCGEEYKPLGLSPVFIDGCSGITATEGKGIMAKPSQSQDQAPSFCRHVKERKWGGGQLLTECSPTPHAACGIWIWEHAAAGSVGWTSACALPLTTVWSRYCCLRAFSVSTHFWFLALSGCKWLPWVATTSFVDPYEPMSNLHPTSKGMGLQPHRLLRPTWNKLRILTNSAIIMEEFKYLKMCFGEAVTWCASFQAMHNYTGTDCHRKL